MLIAPVGNDLFLLLIELDLQPNNDSNLSENFFSNFNLPIFFSLISHSYILI